jgi:hypothetical protein
MRELLRAKGTTGYTSRGAVDRPITATFKPFFFNQYSIITSLPLQVGPIIRIILFLKEKSRIVYN